MTNKYTKINKLRHDMQYVMADIQKERARHDEKMKNFMDDLLDCRTEIFEIIEEMEERNGRPAKEKNGTN